MWQRVTEKLDSVKKVKESHAAVFPPQKFRLLQSEVFSLEFTFPYQRFMATRPKAKTAWWFSSIQKT